MQAQYIYKKGFHKNCCIFYKICLAALKKKKSCLKKTKVQLLSRYGNTLEPHGRITKVTGCYPERNHLNPLPACSETVT